MTHSRNTKLANRRSFPIVCVGASAGGLEALIAMLKFLPKNMNMAVVLIQHLEPQHKSALVDILSRETSLRVCEAKNNTTVELSHVYVIPPNALMAISGRRLKITRRVKRADGRYLPIDFFMASLAEDEKESAIGIILSGTGSDGTEGAKAIKAKGGMVFAQDENTARYFGMPENVIASGSADFILEPREIARKLAGLRLHGVRVSAGRTVEKPGKNDFDRILLLLRDRMGMDFTHYKKPTVIRRVARRMLLHNIKNHAAYYDYLKANAAEADILHKDILIPVTYFFRDDKIFEVIRKKVFPLIINNRSSQNPIRLWVPACSSGEEVYSFAIFLYEFLEKRKIKPYIQVFGTDLSEALITKARVGLYASDITQHVSAERLRRFFTKAEAGYKIAKYIRDMCIFAKHDITTDPPLSNMDIVSCRNLLIYLDTFLQNKALSLFHYALKPNGFLVLGSAESVTAVPGFFTSVDKKQKIYLKNIVPRKTVPMTLESPIRSAKHLKAGGHVLPPKISDKPLIMARSKKPGMTKPAGFYKEMTGDPQKDIVRLKKEFTRTEQRLNAISEEKEAFNEELRAANEEIQSSNEELQSMNEELETSKEELQATNEELITLNEELQNKNADLTHLNSDLTNVFASTNIPIIIVGNDLCIKRFTPTARKVMNLIPTDVDRPIGDIKLNVDIPNLDGLISGVIEDMSAKELEVRDKEGRWYSVRIRPYRTVDNKIDGAIIALIDIDAIKQSREEVERSFNYAKAIIETMREPLLVLDKDLRILSTNKSFCDMFAIKEAGIKNKLLYEINKRQWDDPKLRILLENVLPKKNYFNNFEMLFHLPQIGERTVVLNGRQIKLHGKDSPLILLVIEDITKRKNAEDVLRRDNKDLEKIVHKRSKQLTELQVELVKSKHLSVIGTLAATIAHELRNPLADIAVSVHRVKKIVKDPVVEEILAGISTRVSESDRIIKDILVYSKTVATAIAQFESVKINDILRESIDKEAKSISTGKVAIHEDIDRTKDLTVHADYLQIKEVVLNILHNALDAVSPDTGVIEIRTDIDDSRVSVLIKDNGEGITKKDLKNVTNPFFTTKAKGTGLGLALCKQVMMLHKGSLTIESVQGAGATVVITFPIQQEKDA